MPIRINNKYIFWSISHSKNYVAYAISENPVGVDIEEIKERDDGLLEIFLDGEYKIVGWKNWQNFYKLWTGKEAILKREWLSLDDMRLIQLSLKAWNIYTYTFLGKEIKTYLQPLDWAFLAVTP